MKEIAIAQANGIVETLYSEAFCKMIVRNVILNTSREFSLSESDYEKYLVLVDIAKAEKIKKCNL